METASEKSSQSEPTVQIKRSQRDKAKPIQKKVVDRRMTVGQAIKKLKERGAFDNVSSDSSSEEEKEVVVPKKRGRPAKNNIDSDFDRHWYAMRELINN